MLRDKVIETYGEEAIRLWRDVTSASLDFGFPGGETKRQHLQRLLFELTTSAQQNPNINRWAVSTHGGSLMRLVHHCTGAPAQAIHIQNCALYEIRWEPTTDHWTYVNRHH
jgi:broad specificity phosphatase PhoE